MATFTKCNAVCRNASQYTTNRYTYCVWPRRPERNYNGQVYRHGHDTLGEYWIQNAAGRTASLLYVFCFCCVPSVVVFILSNSTICGLSPQFHTSSSFICLFFVRLAATILLMTMRIIYSLMGFFFCIRSDGANVWFQLYICDARRHSNRPRPLECDT